MNERANQLQYRIVFRVYVQVVIYFHLNFVLKNQFIRFRRQSVKISANPGQHSQWIITNDDDAFNTQTLPK